MTPSRDGGGLAVPTTKMVSRKGKEPNGSYPNAHGPG
jgi:hypothetical protein